MCKQKDTNTQAANEKNVAPRIIILFVSIYRLLKQLYRVRNFSLFLFWYISNEHTFVRVILSLSVSIWCVRNDFVVDYTIGNIFFFFHWEPSYDCTVVFRKQSIEQGIGGFLSAYQQEFIVILIEIIISFLYVTLKYLEQNVEIIRKYFRFSFL